MTPPLAPTSVTAVATIRTLTDEELWALVFEAAGAATAPLLRDSGIVMPDREVADGVRSVMADHGFGVPPLGYRVDERRPDSDAGLAEAKALLREVCDAGMVRKTTLEKIGAFLGRVEP